MILSSVIARTIAILLPFLLRATTVQSRPLWTLKWPENTGGGMLADVRDEITPLRRGLACLRLGDMGCAERELAMASRNAHRADERLIVDVLRARVLNNRGRPREAMGLVDEALDLSPPKQLLPVLEFEKLRAMYRLRDSKAMEAVDTFLSRYAGEPEAVRAAFFKTSLLEQAGRTLEALDTLRWILKHARKREEKAKALAILAELDKAGRQAHLKDLLVRYPETSAASRFLSHEKSLGTKDLEMRSQSFFSVMEYESSLRLEERLWSMGLRTPRRALGLGLLHLTYVRDDPRRAIELIRLAHKGNALPGSEALYLQAKAYAKLEDYKNAWKLYQQYVHSYPRGKHAARARYYLGWLPYDHMEYQKALPWFDRFLRRHRRHRLRSYIAWFKAWALFNMGRHGDALRMFDSLVQMGNPLVAGKGMYWAARTYLLLGKTDKAREFLVRLARRYPMTYYSALGAFKAKEWFGARLPPWMTGTRVAMSEPQPYWADDLLPGRLRAKMRAVRILASVGEVERARTLYHSVARRVERRLRGRRLARFVYTVYSALEDYHHLYRLAYGRFRRKLGRFPKPSNVVYWMMAYPRPHRDMVRELASRFGIPELWVYAIMRQESRYRHRQVSYASALGIMQMIPKTAKTVARELGVTFRLEDFFAPGTNVLFGVYYLARLFQDFRHQLIFASAAYNAGAPPIKRFMQAHQGADFDAMVEFISYNEARNYCRMVATHLLRYALIYMGPERRARLLSMLFPSKVDYQLGNLVDY